MDASLILWDVVEEHLDEAEFLFEMWERGVASPDHTWHDVERVCGERLRAHLDGLVIAGVAAAQRLLLPTLADPEAEACRASACALALLEAPGDEAVWQVMRALAAAPAESGLRSGIARALEVSNRRGLDELLLTAVTSGGGGWIAELWGAMAARRVDPGPGVAEALRSSDPALQAAATRAAVARSPQELWPLVWPLLNTPDASVRLAAIETTVTWGLLAGWEFCRLEAQLGSADALMWAGMLGGAENLGLLHDAAHHPATRHAALRALGHSGYRAAAVECLRWITDADKRTAKLASEAFGAITGIDAFRDGYSLKEPDDEELPALEEDLVKGLDADVEAELPMPEPGAFARWWEAHEAAFEPTRRYLRGQVKTAEVVREAMRGGAMRPQRWLRWEALARARGAIALGAPRIGLRTRWEALAECEMQGDAVWW